MHRVMRQSLHRLLPSFRFWTVAGLTLALDWGTKWAANVLLTPDHPVPIISSVVRFTLSYDSRTWLWLGIPGTPHWQQPTGFVGLALARVFIILSILWIASRAPRRSWGYAIGLGLLFGAAIGNTAEDIGYRTVVNFLDIGIGVHRWPTFNLADALAWTGASFIVYLITRERVTEMGWRDAFSPSFSFTPPKSFRNTAATADRE